MKSLLSKFILIALILVASGCAPKKKEIPEFSYPDKLSAAFAALAKADAIKGKHYLVEGTSMLPAIQPGWYLVADKTPFAALEVGDIIIYKPKWANGKIVVHRVSSIEDTGIIASGDNNRHYENWEYVTPQTYLGKVVRIHKY